MPFTGIRYFGEYVSFVLLNTSTVAVAKGSLSVGPSHAAVFYPTCIIKT